MIAEMAISEGDYESSAPRREGGPLLGSCRGNGVFYMDRLGLWIDCGDRYHAGLPTCPPHPSKQLWATGQQDMKMHGLSLRAGKNTT